MKARKQAPEHEGDVLGISDAKGSIPRGNIRKGGHPQGIELDSEAEKAKSSQHLPQGSGATSIDMGAGGQGNDINPKH